MGSLPLDHGCSVGADHTGTLDFHGVQTMNKVPAFPYSAAEPQSVKEMPKSQDKDLETLVKVSVRNLDFFYGNQQALHSNNLDIASKKVTAIIGPSGCGKSTHIRIYNRIFELYREQRASGEVLMDGVNILSPSVDILELRRKVGMIFQKPTPFPMTVFDNIAWGLKLHYKLSRRDLWNASNRLCKEPRLWTK